MRVAEKGGRRENGGEERHGCWGIDAPAYRLSSDQTGRRRMSASLVFGECTPLSNRVYVSLF